jgi:LmbE family N-acetylglucosaminyl deacetylase
MVAARLINEIYIYQAPSTTLNFKPTIYFDISKYIDTKIKAVKIHSTQGEKVYMAERAIQ